MKSKMSKKLNIQQAKEKYRFLFFEKTVPQNGGEPSNQSAKNDIKLLNLPVFLHLLAKTQNLNNICKMSQNIKKC